MHGLALYGFQAVARNKRMVISLDKVTPCISLKALPRVATDLSCKLPKSPIVACEVSKLKHAVMQLDDQYGSPSFEDIQAFHKVFVPRLADDVGQQLADQIELEISSPVLPVALLRSCQAQRVVKVLAGNACNDAAELVS